MRYLLVDRILAFERDKVVRAIKNVTIESDVMEHHFPGLPIFPGALMLESMAQTAAYLVIRSAWEASGDLCGAVLSTVERAHFRRPVFPGDQLRITVECRERTSNVARLDAGAEVDGQNVARARILLGHRRIDPDVDQDLAEAVRRFLRGLERREGLL